MRRAAVIGCGWLGWPIAKALLEDGWHVIGTTTSAGKLAEMNADGIDPVLYRIGDPGPPPADLVIVNIPPSRTADYADRLESTTSHLPPSTHLIFISTTSVYAARADVFPVERVEPGHPEPIDETTNSRHSPVPVAELIRAEGVFWGARRHRSAILRCGGLTGPGREADRLFAGRPIPDPDKPANLTPLALVIDTIRMILRDSDWETVRNVLVEPRPTRAEAYGSGRA